ncbi:ribosome-associated translation inhibitor RaiA [bacterium]|nr:ribosome-associated translation inhibitor RaiA [bacterium]
MDLTITGRGIKITAPLRNYIQKKMADVLKYFEKLVSAHVKIIVSKERQRAEVVIYGDGLTFKALQVSPDMYASFDEALAKVTGQIKKHKDIVSHKGRHKPKHFGAKIKVITPSEIKKEKHGIISSRRFAIKPMSPSEAAEQMELLDYSFFVFFNPQTEQVNVVYRRKDENYGLIEPEFWF